jgi:hypothetical protein
LRQKTPIFSPNFLAKIFLKIITSVPGHEGIKKNARLLRRNLDALVDVHGRVRPAAGSAVVKRTAETGRVSACPGDTSDAANLPCSEKRCKNGHGIEIFVERRSTIECYCQPPPPQYGNNCMQASLIYKTSQYFHIKKNDTGYLLCIFAIFKLRSTTEQMPSHVLIKTRTLFF